MSIRYCAVEDVQPATWAIQGTVYQKAEEAKYAAAKLFCISTGVRVKRVVDGWALLYWRNPPVSA